MNESDVFTNGRVYYVIKDFDDQAQAEAIFESLKIRDMERELVECLNNPHTLDKDHGWFIAGNELVTIVALNTVVDTVEQISAQLYCVLKNI